MSLNPKAEAEKLAKIDIWLRQHGITAIADNSGVRLYKRGVGMTQAKTEEEAVAAMAYRMGQPGWQNVRLPEPPPSLLIPAGVSVVGLIILGIYVLAHL